MAPLRNAAKFEPFLSFGLHPHTLHRGAIKGKEGIKFYHLATLKLILGAGVTGLTDLYVGTHHPLGITSRSSRHYCKWRATRTIRMMEELLEKTRWIWSVM